MVAVIPSPQIYRLSPILIGLFAESFGMWIGWFGIWGSFGVGVGFGFGFFFMCGILGAWRGLTIRVMYCRGGS